MGAIVNDCAAINKRMKELAAPGSVHVKLSLGTAPARQVVAVQFNGWDALANHVRNGAMPPCIVEAHVRDGGRVYMLRIDSVGVYP